MSRPLFLVDALPASDTAVLDGPEGRHAATVRRLGVGERLLLADGAGAVAECTVTAVHRDTLTLSVGARCVEPAPRPRVVVVQALAKGDRGELAVELLTEAGVDEVVPWAAARSVVEWRGDRGAKALARWRSTAREAAKQARRARLPVVADLATTAVVRDRLAVADRALVLHEAATEPLSAVPLDDRTEVVLVVGPEGGLTDDELAAFTAAGATAVRLGTSVLRTSTAGVAALAVVSARTPRWA